MLCVWREGECGSDGERREIGEEKGEGERLDEGEAEGESLRCILFGEERSLSTASGSSSSESLSAQLECPFAGDFAAIEEGRAALLTTALSRSGPGKTGLRGGVSETRLLESKTGGARGVVGGSTCPCGEAERGVGTSSSSLSASVGRRVGRGGFFAPGRTSLEGRAVG